MEDTAWVRNVLIHITSCIRCTHAYTAVVSCMFSEDSKDIICFLYKEKENWKGAVSPRRQQWPVKWLNVFWLEVTPEQLTKWLWMTTQTY